MNQQELKKLIREVPDWPKKGILFYDITTLLKDADGLRALIDGLAGNYTSHAVDVVLGVEARGFIFAPAVAYRLSGFLSRHFSMMRSNTTGAPCGNRAG